MRSTDVFEALEGTNNLTKGRKFQFLFEAQLFWTGHLRAQA
jgi:hypothetical protein